MLPAEKKIQKLIAENKIPAGTKEVFILPPDSNIQFLPAFYFLPAELVAASKECFEIPRCPAELTDDPEKWAALINSDIFLQLVMEGIVLALLLSARRVSKA